MVDSYENNPEKGSVKSTKPTANIINHFSTSHDALGTYSHCEQDCYSYPDRDGTRYQNPIIYPCCVPMCSNTFYSTWTSVSTPEIENILAK